MYLFEKAKAYAYVIQWAEAALFAVQAEEQSGVSADRWFPTARATRLTK